MVQVVLAEVIAIPLNEYEPSPAVVVERPAQETFAPLMPALDESRTKPESDASL